MQTFIATSEVTKQIHEKNPYFHDMNHTGYGNFLVISLGTGSAKLEHKYDAKIASKWGIVGWLKDGGSNPIIDAFADGSDDMVDYHISVIFQSVCSQKQYLRIQVLYIPLLYKYYFYHFRRLTVRGIETISYSRFEFET